VCSSDLSHKGEGRTALGVRLEQANRRVQMKSIRGRGLLVPSVFLLLFSGFLLLLTGSEAFAQLPGDLDTNDEVNLADLVEFVGCLNGPKGVAIDSACDPGNFDSDTDIDLRDFASFQTRFGLGQGPPQIVSFTPEPGAWIVDDIGLTEITVGFSEPVIVPEGSVDVWLVSGLPGAGTVTDFTTSYDPVTYMLTITFAPALRDDRVTLVVDYTIEDMAGNPLDGEIFDPKNAVLPSGNDVNGGQGVFRIRVLQGDANRDGFVNASDETVVNDSLGLCDTDTGFDAMADVNSDDCVDATDVNIVAEALGNQLPVTDGVQPIIVKIREPTFDQQGFDRIIVDFNEVVSDPRITVRTCFLVDGSGNVVIPTSAVGGPFGTTAVYNFAVPLPQCGAFTINVNNAIADFSGELLASPGPMVCP